MKKFATVIFLLAVSSLYGQEDVQFIGNITIIKCSCTNDTLTLDTIVHTDNSNLFILNISNCNESNLLQLPKSLFFADQVEISADFNVNLKQSIKKFVAIKHLTLNGPGINKRVLKELKHLQKIESLNIKNTEISRIPRTIKNVHLREFVFSNGKLRNFPRWINKSKISVSITIENSGATKIHSSIFQCPANFVYIYEKNAKMDIKAKDIMKMLQKEYFTVSISNAESVLMFINNHIDSDSKILLNSANTMVFHYDQTGSGFK